MITKILKRDGRRVPFNVEKIAKAIYQAAVSVGGENYEEAQELAYKVCDYLERKYGKIQLSKIFPVKKVFNKRQIAILKYSFFIDKTDLVDILLKHI